MTRKAMRLRVVLPSALAAVLIAGGVAIAATTGIVGADGKINGCYRDGGNQQGSSRPGR